MTDAQDRDHQAAVAAQLAQEAGNAAAAQAIIAQRDAEIRAGDTK